MDNLESPINSSADVTQKTAKNKKAKIPAKTLSNANTAAAQHAGPLRSFDYAGAQSDEIEALNAIYMGDFEEIEVKSAWNKTTDRSFRLTVRSFSDEDSYIILIVRLTASYPKTLPILEVKGMQRFHERTQTRINNIILERPKKLILLGDVMIHAIVVDIQDALEDAVRARESGTLPSLEHERASAEEVAMARAEQTKEDEARKQQEAQEEEEQVLKQRVDEEIERREKFKPTKSSTIEETQVANGAESDTIVFDQPAILQGGGQKISFNKVTILSPLSQKPNERIFLGKAQTSDTSILPLIAIKRIRLRKSLGDIVELEKVLAINRKLRHANLLSVLAYRIDKLDSSKFELILCSEYADRGSLRDLLECGDLHVRKARHFTVELLDALDYLHRSGLAHGNLNADTIAMVGHPTTSPKLADFAYSGMLQDPDAESLEWPTPESGKMTPAMLQRADIWQFGVVVVQMFLGLDVVNEHRSPQHMTNRLDLSQSFSDFLGKVFNPTAKKRLSAFELQTAEFLRTEDPARIDSALSRETTRKSSFSLEIPSRRRSRRNSSNMIETLSRYVSDFTEVARLGKGGFGEVVKARHKVDGGVYAVKKIKQAGQDFDRIINEVRFLAKLSHPFVVRYIYAFTDHAVSEDSTTDAETSTDPIEEDEDSDGPRMDFGYQSTGGLDFVSSRDYPEIEFADDSASESGDQKEENEGADPAVQIGSPAIESDNESSADFQLQKPRSASQKAPSMLYILMEYCEGQTLRALLQDKNIGADESWRYVRQITEGLAHVHEHGIVHRDLKPDNIFFDIAGNPKIGDFGLATITPYQFLDTNAKTDGRSAGDMTRSVGTALYVAPELRSASGRSDSNKPHVDMYSLGIMFYEMCELFSTGAERISILQKAREKEHELPSMYQPGGEKATQGKLISRLISHTPSDRPSSAELLRSSMLPVKVEDEAIREALSGLSDSASPYHQRMMSALFAQDSSTSNEVKAGAWDSRTPDMKLDPDRLRLRGLASQTLEAVFRRHGAEEAPRLSIFPRSGFYSTDKVLQVLDTSGTLLQLPYDLILPHAKQLGRQSSDIRCTFAFGSAYRGNITGSPPTTNEEVDFDIVDSGNSDEQSMNDAEVIKVMDEIVCEMPLFSSTGTTSFHVNHSSILTAILEHCRVPVTQQPVVKETLSKFGSHNNTWRKIRAELRSMGLADTTLNDLEPFAFHDTSDRAFAQLKKLLLNLKPRMQTKVNSAVLSLSRVIHLVTLFNVQHELCVAPLSCVNAKFYEDGILFQCVLKGKSSQMVIAAGGRYDSLIRLHRVRGKASRNILQGAVGVSIGLGPVIDHMWKNTERTSRKASIKRQSDGEITERRCEVIIAADGSEGVQNTGIKLLTSLWANDISAELAMDKPTSNKDYNFVVTVRHQASNSVRVSSTEAEAEEVDVQIPALVSFLQHQLREGSKIRQPTLLRQVSLPDADSKGSVEVLTASHGSKKVNKFQVVVDARERWTRKLNEIKSSPILAVETRDEVLDMIKHTRLSDAEGWRKVAQSVPLNERTYVPQIQERLALWRKEWKDGDGVREVCVYNFRSQHCIYYDLGL